MKTHVDPGRSNFGASRTHINNRLSFNFSRAILTRQATSHYHSLPACLLPAMQAQQTDSSKQALPSLPSPARLAHHHHRRHPADVAAALSGLPSLPPLPEERAVTRIRRDGHPVRRDSRSPKLDLENYQRRALILAPRYLNPGTYRGNPRLPGFDEADELPSTTPAAATMLSPAESTLNLREMEQEETTRANSSARRSTRSQTRRQSRADSSTDSKDFAEMPKESNDVPAGLSVRKVANSIKKPNIYFSETANPHTRIQVEASRTPSPRPLLPHEDFTAEHPSPSSAAARASLPPRASSKANDTDTEPKKQSRASAPPPLRSTAKSIDIMEARRALSPPTSKFANLSVKTNTNGNSPSTSPAVNSPNAKDKARVSFAPSPSRDSSPPKDKDPEPFEPYDYETVSVRPPIHDFTKNASELWESTSLSTSRPAQAWGASKRWSCCQCSGQTIVESKVCSRCKYQNQLLKATDSLLTLVCDSEVSPRSVSAWMLNFGAGSAESGVEVPLSMIVLHNNKRCKQTRLEGLTALDPLHTRRKEETTAKPQLLQEPELPRLAYNCGLSESLRTELLSHTALSRTVRLQERLYR